MVAVHHPKFPSFPKVCTMVFFVRIKCRHIYDVICLCFCNSGDTASCLHNAPHEDEALGRALPGTLLSLDAQCRRDRGTSACFKDERVCAQLFCFDAASGYCVAYRPAAEGSSCGDGSVSVQHEFLIVCGISNETSYAALSGRSLRG